MMLEEPNCYTRGCKWFQGVGGDPDSETGEVPICAAFPKGIPLEIAYGDNDHTAPYLGDNGLRYMKEEVLCDLLEPKCYTRGCRHFIGVSQPDGTELSECVVCAAFPHGIPNEIAYGDNDHATSHPGDNGIQFEKGDGNAP